LVAGSLSIHVQKLEPAQSFVLELPDGQLEVRGTRFRVEADKAHTKSVSVSEGVVVLGVRGDGARVLRAGQSWARSDREQEAVERPAAISPTTAPSASAQPKPSPGARDGFVAPAASSSADREPGRAFSLAMEAFDAGNNGLAEQRLRAFLRKYPGDSRSEDATFLCAVARARQGDRTGAARWAQRYLVAYPNGLRRREAEGMVRAAPSGNE
jgi:TolA-binding protein